MKTKLKTSSQLKNQTILQNSNFLNNQNYVISNFFKKIIEFIPEYNIEKKYFKYINKKNFRNNQNYVFDKENFKYVKIYTNFTFYWGSRVRRKKKNEIKNKVNDHFKIFIVFFILNIIALFFIDYLVKIVIIYFIFLILPLIFLVLPFFKSKKLAYVFDDNKYIILILKNRLKKR